VWIRLIKTSILVAAIGSVPARAEAQQRGNWEVSVVPLYFWAMELDGSLSVGPVTVPVFLEFADAADKLGGAFALHFEANRGRWGVLTDVNFIRLTSSATFALAGRPIEGEFELDNIMFELAGSYRVNQRAGLDLTGGLRTYTLSPKVRFRAPNTELTPIDTSATSPNAFVGVRLQPRINDRWTFLARGDIGAGNADFTWSGGVGFAFRVTSWGSLEFGYKALGIEATTEDRIVRAYDMTHYGPIVGFRLRWGR
jgi:hypothetical protein